MAGACVGDIDHDFGFGQESAALTAESDGPCGRGREIPVGGTVSFESLGQTVRLRLCDEAGTFTQQWIDIDSGLPVDFERTRLTDIRTFKDQYHSIDASLRATLSKIDPDAIVDVDVWYAVREDDLPSKEEQLQTILTTRETNLELELRIWSGAQELAAEIRRSSIPAEIVSNLQTTAPFRVPFVHLRARARDLESIGALDGVVNVLPAMKPKESLGEATEDYFYIDNGDQLDDNGWDGSSRTVAILEGTYPNSWQNLSGAVSTADSDHQCVAPMGGGGSRKCHCPNNVTDPNDGHSRRVTGVVRNSAVSYLGMADQVATISANILGVDEDGTCADTGNNFGPTDITSAIGWALDNGATVINYSAGPIGLPVPGNPQSSEDLMFDYIASHAPYPLFVGSSGNGGNALRVSKSWRNGLLVGGANDFNQSDRELAKVTGDSRGANHSSGWELPHLVAISQTVASAGIAVGTIDGTGIGTSYAAPQVSAIAAAMQEQNSILTVWPELMVAGLLVSADQNTDEDAGGVWPLEISDGIDDLDGAGLVSGSVEEVLQTSFKVNGGNTLKYRAHDYGSMFPSSTPASTFYSEVYNARVAGGETLVAASVLTARPSCDADGVNCTTTSYPIHAIVIYDGATIVDTGINAAQNYALASVHNSGSTARDYQIKILLLQWSGLLSTGFGIAWGSDFTQ